MGARQVAQWKAETGKPYGIYGITIGSVDDAARDLLTGAMFAFFRDSVSLQFAKDNGVACPVMEFGPDGAFAVDLRSDEAAAAFLKKHDLCAGQFLCCIPRLRYTPYRKIRNKPMTAEDDRKHARNEAIESMTTRCSAKRSPPLSGETDLKVLICPEDESQMAVRKGNALRSASGRREVPRRRRENYWLTDEALSTHDRSAGLFGLEMHSPIMCIGTAFRRSSAGSPSRPAKASCSATSASRTGCSTWTPRRI